MSIDLNGDGIPDMVAFGKSDWNNNMEDNNGDYVIQVSSKLFNTIAAIIILLLIINIAFLSYYNCCKTSKKEGKQRYRKVSQIVSSDDDIQNLKEYAV